MFAFVVMIFMVCWAPYHIYFIYSYHNPSIARKAYIGHIFLFFYWLAMSNTCVNPIIYYVMNSRFRAYFNKVLCCIPNYLKHSTSRRWSRCASSTSKLSFISRSQSCPVELNTGLNGSISMPPRALRMKHSHTIQPGIRKVDTATNTMSRHAARRVDKQIRSMQSMQSMQSMESAFYYRSSEVLLWFSTKQPVSFSLLDINMLRNWNGRLEPLFTYQMSAKMFIVIVITWSIPANFFTVIVKKAATNGMFLPLQLATEEYLDFKNKHSHCFCNLTLKCMLRYESIFNWHELYTTYVRWKKYI